MALEKLHGSGFSGNAYTDHGRAREPEIARWVLGRFGIEPSTALFHAAGNREHLATPDGVTRAASGSLELAEIKTTKSAWRSIPPFSQRIQALLPGVTNRSLPQAVITSGCLPQRAARSP